MNKLEVKEINILTQLIMHHHDITSLFLPLTFKTSQNVYSTVKGSKE